MEPPFLLPQEDRTAGQTALHSTLLTSLHTKGPERHSAALSAPANTKEENPTSTGDHHAEHNTRRRAVECSNYLNITWDTNSHDTKTLPTTGISHRKTFTTHKYQNTRPRVRGHNERISRYSTQTKRTTK